MLETLNFYSCCQSTLAGGIVRRRHCHQPNKRQFLDYDFHIGMSTTARKRTNSRALLLSNSMIILPIVRWLVRSIVYVSKCARELSLNVSATVALCLWPKLKHVKRLAWLCVWKSKRKSKTENRYGIQSETGHKVRARHVPNMKACWNSQNKFNHKSSWNSRIDGRFSWVSPLRCIYLAILWEIISKVRRK